MANVLLAIALVGVGAYLVRRILRLGAASRGLDAGTLSHAWIAEQRREEPR